MSTRTHQLFFISKALSLQRTFSEPSAKDKRRKVGELAQPSM